MIQRYAILVIFTFSSFGVASAGDAPIAPLTVPSKAEIMNGREDRPPTHQEQVFGVASADDGEPVAPLTVPSKQKKKAKEDRKPTQQAADPNTSFTDAAKINQDSKAR